MLERLGLPAVDLDGRIAGKWVELEPRVHLAQQIRACPVVRPQQVLEVRPQQPGLGAVAGGARVQKGEDTLDLPAGGRGPAVILRVHHAEAEVQKVLPRETWGGAGR